jgi:hypothetical protein
MVDTRWSTGAGRALATALSWRPMGAALALLLCAIGCRAQPPSFQREWTYVSATSAVTCWQLADIAQTATSYVEYGATPALGEQTPAATEPRWAHFHRLSGLDRGATHHYRMVVVDPSSGQETRGQITTLTTRALEDSIRIPADRPGPPLATSSVWPTIQPRPRRTRRSDAWGAHWRKPSRPDATPSRAWRL